MAVGRNAPCPCGSGKKYKRCCGQNSAAAALEAGRSVQDTAQQLLLKANQLAQSKQFLKAEELAERVAQSSIGGPRFQAFCMLGDIRSASGRPDAASVAYETALMMQPQNAALAYNAATSAMHAQQWDRALELFRVARDLSPNDPEVHENLGITLIKSGHVQEAVTHLQEFICRYPNRHSAQFTLAGALSILGHLKEALAVLAQLGDERVLQSPHACTVAGSISHQSGDFRQAERYYLRAKELAPKEGVVFSSLLTLFSSQGMSEEAFELVEEWIACEPDNLEHLFRAANLHGKFGDYEGGLSFIRHLESGERTSDRALLAFANFYRVVGQVDKAVEFYSRHLRRNPSSIETIPAWIMLSYYLSSSDEDRLFAAAQKMGERLEARNKDFLLSSIPLKTRESGVIRVGFVSADLRRHSVAYFVESIFSNINQTRFELYVYDNGSHPDDMTAKLQRLVPHWRYIKELSDREACILVRDDQLDILVDLSGLTRGHRHGIFAARAAPIQVTWIGFPGTTGVPAMDFRFTDALSDPEGASEKWYVERLWRLPEIFSCYCPPLSAPEVSVPPSSKGIGVTFGSFNNFKKITPELLGIWAQILRQVPDSSLLLKAEALKTDANRRFVREFLENNGVASDRVEMLVRDKGLEEHLGRYASIDIGLDTYPYCGTTTTCEALWMGVPVVSLAGPHHRSRVGLSQLSSIGLPELVGHTESDYIDIAVGLAKDPERLADLRAGMRQRMLSSPLVDAPTFVKGLEEALIAMRDEVAVG